MTYSEVKAELQKLGLKEIAAQNWAIKLTHDDREPTLQEVEDFAEKTLPAARKVIADRKARRPAEMLTTPEEKFHD